MSEATMTHVRMTVRNGDNETHIRMRSTDPDTIAKVHKALGKDVVVKTKGEDGKYRA